MDIRMLTAILLFSAAWAVLCRINLMKRGRTVPAVFAQHFVLGMGLFGGAVLPFFVAVEWGLLCIAGGILAFLLVGTARWRHGAPAGITRPGALEDEEQLKHVSGGRK